MADSGERDTLREEATRSCPFWSVRGCGLIGIECRYGLTDIFVPDDCPLPIVQTVKVERRKIAEPDDDIDQEDVLIVTEAALFQDEPAPTPDMKDGNRHKWCRYSGPGRGDCLHFIGVPNVLDSTTTDEYGIPYEWCDYCWLKYRTEQPVGDAALRKLVTRVIGLTTFHGGDGQDVYVFKKHQAEWGEVMVDIRAALAARLEQGAKPVQEQKP